LKAVLRVYKGLDDQNAALPPWASSDPDPVLSQLIITAPCVSQAKSLLEGMEAGALPGGITVSLVRKPRPDFQDPEFEPLTENQHVSFGEVEMDDDDSTHPPSTTSAESANSQLADLNGTGGCKMVVIHCWGAWVSSSIRSAVHAQHKPSAESPGSAQHVPSFESPGCSDEKSMPTRRDTGLKATSGQKCKGMERTFNVAKMLPCHSDDASSSSMRGTGLSLKVIRVLCQRLAAAVYLQEAAEVLSTTHELSGGIMARRLLQVALQLISMPTLQPETRVQQHYPDVKELQGIRASDVKELQGIRAADVHGCYQRTHAAPMPVLGKCHVLRMRLSAAYLKALIDAGGEWLAALEVREQL
jgi:hypothetical protein